MIIATHRPTKLIIDQAAIRYNISTEVARLDQGTELFMVVKANGYGHGAIQAAKAAKEAGATGFCVALLDEALELRAAGFTEPLLVLGITPPREAALMAEKNISATVGSIEWFEQALPYMQAAPKNHAPLHYHIALDTGMGRIGFQAPSELTEAVNWLSMTANAREFMCEGIFTHFATADEKDETYFKTQVARFKEFMAVLPERPRYVHVSNSATSLWHAACNGNMIRFGAAGYGLNPSGTALVPPYELKPAMALETELNFSKLLPAGRSVSYGATYTAKQDEWIGTIPIGYSDGYERRLTGFHVLVDGQECEIVGRICMDQMMIRLPGPYDPGTKVVMIGRSGDREITIQEVAEYCQTIHYEIACGFTARLQKTYIN